MGSPISREAAYITRENSNLASLTRVGESSHSGNSAEDLIKANLFAAYSASTKHLHFLDDFEHYCRKFSDLSMQLLNEETCLEDDRKDVRQAALTIMRLLNQKLLILEVPPFEIKNRFFNETTMRTSDFFTHLLNGLGVDLAESVKSSLRKLFSKYLITNFASLDSKENRQIFERMLDMPEIYELSTDNSENRLINEITVLWVYRERVIDSIKPDHDMSVKIMQILFKKKVKEPNEAKEAIDSLIAHLFVKKLNRLLLSKMRQVIALQEQKEKDLALFYDKFKSKVLDTINHSYISNILLEFLREVLGGYVAFKTEGEMVVPPFKRRTKDSQDEEETRIQEWVREAEEWAGTNIFQERELVTRVTEALSIVAADPLFAAERRPDVSSSSSALEIHAKNFETLMALWDDRNKREAVIRKLEEALAANRSAGNRQEKKKRVIPIETVVEYIMELHRLGTQVILLSAMDVVLSCHSAIFTKLRKYTLTQGSKSEKEIDSKSIMLDKVGKTLETTLTYMRNFKRFPSSQLIQRIIYKRPLPRQKPIEDPISVQFFYKPPQNMQGKESEDFIRYISELSFVIKALNFPDFQEEMTSNSGVSP